MRSVHRAKGGARERCCGRLKEPGFFASTLASADLRSLPLSLSLSLSLTLSFCSFLLLLLFFVFFFLSQRKRSRDHCMYMYRQGGREEKRVQGERLIERREPGHHHRRHHRLLQLLDAEIHRDNLIPRDFGQRNPTGLVNSSDFWIF